MRTLALKRSLVLLTLAGVYAGSSLAAAALQSTPQPRRGTAETSLVGISLYDTGAKVVGKFGSPDDIQALNVGGGGNTGGPGGGNGPGGGGPSDLGGGGGLNQPATRPDRSLSEGLIGDPFNDPNFNQAAPAAVPGGGGQSSRGGGPPALGDNAGPGGGRPGAAGGGGATAGASQSVIYTRWVYNRKNSRYAFVFDKFNRVVQIEAVGMSNRSARTKRGITFGSSFASVIKAYNAPDGYEISGNHIVTRFLVRDRVAFRLSKLKADGPHVVTGIVVAAGKTGS